MTHKSPKPDHKTTKQQTKQLIKDIRRFIKTQNLKFLTGVSPYTIASDHLSHLTHPKLIGETTRQHLERLHTYIRTCNQNTAKQNRHNYHTIQTQILSRRDQFLHSIEWKTLRIQALQKYTNKCACCGNTPQNGAILNVDHIKPRKLFPELALDLNNLQILCSDCNAGKGNWNQTDWRTTNNLQ